MRDDGTCRHSMRGMGGSHTQDPRRRRPPRSVGGSSLVIRSRLQIFLPQRGARWRTSRCLTQTSPLRIAWWSTTQILLVMAQYQIYQTYRVYWQFLTICGHLFGHQSGLDESSGQNSAAFLNASAFRVYVMFSKVCTNTTYWQLLSQTTAPNKTSRLSQKQTETCGTPVQP